jgi:uncharacterized membrane protein YbhN (UPF0104 family)
MAGRGSALSSDGPLSFLGSGTRRTPARRRASLAIRWILGLALTILALRQVDMGDLAAGLRQVDPGWLLIALATIMLGIGLKAIRWGLLLKPVCPDRSAWDVLGALMTGQAANIVLPLRGGELVRTATLISPSDGRAGAVFVGIGMEKAFDLLALAAAAGLALPLLPTGARSTIWIGPLAAGLALLGAALAVGLFWRRAWACLRPLLVRLPEGMRNRLQGWMDRLSDGLERLARSGQLWRVLTLTAVIWLVMFSTNLTLLRALQMKVSASAAMLVLVAVHLGLIPAIMPGNVGPFYLAVELGLSPFGYNLPLAAPYAVLLHALVTLTPLAGAGLYLAAGRRHGGRL